MAYIEFLPGKHLYTSLFSVNLTQVPIDVDVEFSSLLNTFP